MNWTLGIDTSSTELSVGLFRGTEPVASYSRFLKNSHAENIAQAVQLVLGSCGVDSADITNIAIAVGPGSFTGLRIGFAFVKGFCMIGQTRVMPVSSLFVLAHSATGRASSAVAAIDARRGEVFWARFSVKGSVVQRKTADTAGTVEDFRNFIKQDDTIIYDTNGYEKSTVFDFLAGRPQIFPARQYPVERGLCCSAIGVAAANEPSVWKNALDALPEYLRSFTSPSLSKYAGAQ
jgi:tRNA threonylcarbamoyladenosine biosynthesis protein TsaB